MTYLFENLNWIDYTIFAIVGVSAVISFFRGFVREAVSLLAWVLGLFAALKFSLSLQVYLAPWLTHEGVRYFICFVAIFLGVVIAGMLINLLIGFLLKSTGLSFLDRFVGIIFGTLRGIAIVAVLLLLLTNMASMQESMALHQSKWAHQFKPIVTWLHSFLPEKMNRMTTWVMNDFRNHKPSL